MYINSANASMSRMRGEVAAMPPAMIPAVMSMDRAAPLSIVWIELKIQIKKATQQTAVAR